MSVNYIDLLLILIVLLSAYYGWYRGFILGLLDLLRWAGALLAALPFSPPLARWIAPHFDWAEAWDRPVAFLFTAFVAGLTIQLLGSALLRRLPKDVHERRLNRVFGVAPGIASGVITASIAAALLMAAPLPDGARPPAAPPRRRRPRPPGRPHPRLHRCRAADGRAAPGRHAEARPRERTRQPAR